jgi:glycosyltransferase involved in cell wall biosynthesis
MFAVRPIAFAVPGDLATPTGGYVYDRRIITELKQLGWPVTPLNLGDGYPWPSHATLASAHERLQSVPDNDPLIIDGLAFGVLPDLWFKLRERHPLVALVHLPLALEIGLSAQQIALLRKSERAALKSATRVIVTSNTTARHLISHYGVTSDLIVVAPPGVDRACSALGSSNGVVQLLSIGAVVPGKGFDLLVRALATLSELPWRLWIVGDRTRDMRTVAALDDAIARFGLAERIKMFGSVARHHLEQFFDRADLFVLASRYESYGMAYTEAIAHGLPIIGTTAGAIPETIPAGAGLLVPPDDQDALASALRRLIERPEERLKIAAGARRAICQLPKWVDAARAFARSLDTLRLDAN